ncbi:nonstructural protein [Dipodfec virus UOA04_Rod_615]|nr:nonstructural protein [Dipodfec virus UOA04_Rod_615]
MILKIYALYDKDAETLNERTFNAPNEKVAKRILKETLKNDRTLANNAEHYELHDCGQYDTESGISGDGKSKHVCGLEELLGMAEPASQAPSAE